ncbi:unnamed protein product [Umbelopsis vinacea]
MPKAIRKKLVVVGDGGCGKTSLLVVYQKKEFPMKYVPTVFENYISLVQLENGKSVELALWDTAGQEDYDRLRPLSYPETDVVLICFAIDQPTSFSNIQDRVSTIIKVASRSDSFLRKDPIDLGWHEIDLRKNEKRISDLNAIGHNLISYEEGTRLARDIGAKYFECSAKENINVNGVIHAATLEALKPRGLTKKFCSIL